MRLRRYLLKSSFLAIAFLFLSGNVYALDLTQYIAQPGFIAHGLSTGEWIRFSGEPGGGGIRMYKNSNYEQFFLGGSGYRRREDTSWAPLPGFNAALCANGNRAIYALHPANVVGSISPGWTMNSTGAFWAPANADLGDNWPTGEHTIVPIDSTQTPDGYDFSGILPLTYCQMNNLSGYPAWVPTGSQILEYSAHYGPNEYIFCNGVSNPEDMIVITTISGPGAGDTFFFMRGYGMVGFETAGFQAGLASIEGVGDLGGDSSMCMMPGMGTSGPRTIVGRVTSARITIDPETGSEVSNQPVEGVRVCAYHGTHQGGKDILGTGVYGYYYSDTTDEDGVFRIESEYEPGTHYSYGGFTDADIIVFYTGRNYQEAQILPMAHTMENLGIDSYNRTLYGELDEEHTLIPLDDIQVDADTEVTPSNFDGIPGFEPADLYGTPHPECPKSAFYVNRELRERSSCELGMSLGQEDWGAETKRNRIDVMWSGDDQHLGRETIFENGDPDYTELEEIDPITVPNCDPSAEFDTSAEGCPEGRVTSRQTFMALEEMRAAVCKIIGCKKLNNQPKSEIETISAEMQNCEDIREYLGGEGSLKARGIGLHLASPSYYTDGADPSYDINDMSTKYRTNLEALERPYCWTESGEVILFGEVEPYETWKYPGETGTYKLSSEYFDPRFVYIYPASEYEYETYPDPSSHSYESKDGGILNTKSFIYGGPLFDANHLFDPTDFEDDYDQAIDNNGHAWRHRLHPRIPGASFGQNTADAVSATQYTGTGTVPPTDYISPPIYVNDRVQAQANRSIASIDSDLRNSGYYQSRGRIGVQDLLCGFSSLDGHRLWPIVTGFRGALRVPTTEELPDVTNGGWFESYYDFRAETVGLGGERIQEKEGLHTLFKYYMSRGPWAFISNLIIDAWSVFNITNKTNYYLSDGSECGAMQWVDTDEATCKDGLLAWLFPKLFHDENCREVERTRTVGCEEGSEGCTCTYDDNGALVKCTRTDSYTVAQVKDFNPYACIADGRGTELRTRNEMRIESRNSLVGINQFTNLLSTPTSADPRTEELRMYGLDTYASGSPPEGRTQGEGTMGEIGQGTEAPELGKLVADPIF